MAAPDHINPQQVAKVYHGTMYPWRSQTPQASYDSPLHVAQDTDLPGDYAFAHGIGGYDPATDWETMTTGHIKEFAVSPEAKIHHTTTGHFDAALPDEENEHVRRVGADMTMFPGGLGIVYNPAVLTHVRDIGYREHTRMKPEDEMEYMHGEDWRDLV